MTITQMLVEADVGADVTRMHETEQRKHMLAMVSHRQLICSAASCAYVSVVVFAHSSWHSSSSHFSGRHWQTDGCAGHAR